MFGNSSCLRFTSSLHSSPRELSCTSKCHRAHSLTNAELSSFIRQSGVLKPGEMCLVLGCPGAGCTTFLKAIANERHEYARVGGDVRYAGISAAEMAKTYKGEVAYNEEGKLPSTPCTHYANLLHQTIVTSPLSPSDKRSTLHSLQRRLDLTVVFPESLVQSLTKKSRTCFFVCSTSRTPSRPMLVTSLCAVYLAVNVSVFRSRR